MLEILEFYVRVFAVALPLLATAILMIGAIRAQLTSGQTIAGLAMLAALFGAWFATAVPLAEAGVFNVPATVQDPPVVLGFLFAGAIVIWALSWLTPVGRRVTLATPLSAIAAFQVPRVMGAVFIVAWLFGSLPTAFAIPAGLGDIWAGIAGYQASVALAKGAPEGRRLLVRATIIGMADFAVAVAAGIMTSEGFAHLLAKDVPNIINDYPLALFPAFFVPIFLGFHFIALSRLWVDQRASRSVTEQRSV